jgi:signal transduction histidine kinase
MRMASHPLSGLGSPPGVPGSAGDLRDIAESQAALRRVATLVAEGAEPESLFDAIAGEASRIFGIHAISLIRWDSGQQAFTQIAVTHTDRAIVPNGTRVPASDSPLGTLIVTSGRPARIDDWAGLPGPLARQHRDNGFGQAVGVPIIVDGTVWGYIGGYGNAGEALPARLGERLAEFTDLMAMAIANAQAKDDLRAVAAEQGALRRVATLVAQGAEPRAVFMAVATEAAGLLRVEAVSLIRWDPKTRLLTKIYGTHGRRAAVPDGGQWGLEDAPEGAMVVATGRPVRLDDWTVLPGPVAARHVANGFGQCVAAPIVVDGDLWGMISAFGEASQALPPDSESRLAHFTHLMAMAIANAQARDELHGLAEQQAALRRVATLAAQGAEPHAVFAAVVTETARVLRVGLVSLLRRDPGTGLVTKVYGTHGEPVARPNGTVWRPPDGSLTDVALRAGRPLRIDDWRQAQSSAVPPPVSGEGFTQCACAPITVNGEPWGVLMAFGADQETLPAGAEAQLADFTHLMATAMANAQARDELRALAEQQGAALRRVATLVAAQAPQRVIFDAVAAEASRALRVPRADVLRCDPDESVTPLGAAPTPLMSHDRASLATRSASATRLVAEVRMTGRIARTDSMDEDPAVAAPITVDGTTWGVIIVHGDEPLPDDTETRLTDFTHLVASSISNVAARDKLIASRARIVSASDETRRRIERNLHDGVQQRILAVALQLRAVRAQSLLPDAAQDGLDDVAADLEAVLEEIRVFSRGLHPALLARSGLGPSLRELARRSPIPVELEVAPVGRLPQPIETAVYYVASESLANAAKHSHASCIWVTLTADTTRVCVRVADDGAGGASADHGSGLVGLVDRVEALGGRLTLDSPPGGGTTITVELPLASHLREATSPSRLGSIRRGTTPAPRPMSRA